MIWLIRRHGFDNSKHDEKDAELVMIIGYKKTEEEALEYIDKMQQRMFVGWNGHRYPYYTAISIFEL